MVQPAVKFEMTTPGGATDHRHGAGDEDGHGAKDSAENAKATVENAMETSRTVPSTAPRSTRIPGFEPP